MNNSEPPISVLLPLKRAEKNIPKIRNFIAANLGIFDEVVVVNDGGDGNHEILLREWANADRRVQIIPGPKTNLVQALNLGLKTCKNDWVARFDGDDEYPSDRLAIQRAAISNHKKSVAIFGDYTFTSIDGNSLGTIPSPVFSNFTENSLIASQRTAHPSVVFNKEAVLAVGAYREQDRHVEDLSLWLRLSKVGKLRSVPANVLNYSLHAESLSAKNREYILSKTKFIIEEIGVNRRNATDCLLALIENGNPYDGFEFSFERHLLAIREVQLFNRISPLPESSIRALSARKRGLLVHPGYLLAAVHLMNQRQKRIKIRKKWESLHS